MKKTILILTLFCISLFAQKINVAVAANVSYAINDLIKEFNKSNPNTKVLVTLGSSGKLTAQIRNGAPYDIFMSANMKYPNSLFEDKIAITKPIVYAQGSLALLSGKKIELSKGLELLKDKEIKKIAIANPKTAPYGKATVQALKNAKIYDLISNKFVYAESISQTVTYATRATDVGFIAKSSLYSSKMRRYKKDIDWIDLESSLYTPINQGIVILKNSNNSNEAKAFYDFILSAKAKMIFKEFGYLIP